MKVEINDLKKLKAAHESVLSVRNVVLIHVAALMSVFKDVFSRCHVTHVTIYSPLCSYVAVNLLYICHF